MAESQLWNSLEDKYLEQCFIASKASENGSALSSKGKYFKLRDCGIDTKKISTLGDYLSKQRLDEGKSFDSEEITDLRDDENLAKVYVVPVILPNGEEVQVIVNQKGQDMACIYRDQEGNQKTFQLTERMEEEIVPNGLEEIVGRKVIEQELLAKDLDEFAEKVSKDELVPKTREEALKRVSPETEKESKGEDAKKVDAKKVEAEIEEAEKEVPAEARDIIAEICSEHDLDIRNLKEVMEVEPEVINDNLEDTGIQENNGTVYCLRFRDGGNLQGRVVMVQGSKAIDNRNYDSYMNDYMNEHRGERYVESAEDEHDKLIYTDLDGNTTVCEMYREPRDMNCSDKEILQAEMQKLDSSTKQILTSDMPLELKTQEIIKINGKRLDLFREYGIEVPTIENEIEADIDLSEEVGENATESREEMEDRDDDEPEAFEVPGKRTH